MNEIEKFRNDLLREGVIGYSSSQLQYLLNVAKLCAKQNGLPTAAATAILTAGAGSVMIPGVGAVPGWVAGALAGFVSGTMTCTIARGSLKPQLDQLVRMQ